MALEKSILGSVKSSIGDISEYTEFDQQLLILINSVFSTLHQLGYGPDEGFEIEDYSATWDDYILNPRMNFIKHYIIAKVHVAFDPPSSSIAMNALEKQIAEYEWRINSESECYNEVT